MFRKAPITPATTISLVALFFSLGGASLAASRYLITSKWQIAPSVRSALRGERGPVGPTGPQGEQGAEARILDIAEQGPVSSVPAGGSATATATCPLGQLTGGGATADGLVIQESHPEQINTPVGVASSSQTWTVVVTNPTAVAALASAWVICTY